VFPDLPEIRHELALLEYELLYLEVELLRCQEIHAQLQLCLNWITNSFASGSTDTRLSLFSFITDS